jgi:serine/threonine protein phosphatase PrpC
MEGTTLLHTALATASVGLLGFVAWAWLRPGEKSVAPGAASAAAVPSRGSESLEHAGPATKASVGVEAAPAARVSAHEPAAEESHDDTERLSPVSEAHARALAEDPFDDDAEATRPNALILVTAHGRTDPGLKRKHNEDALLLLEAHHLFLIADGMGRHAAGEVASQLAVDAVGSSFVTGNFGEFPRDNALTERGSRLKRAIQVANKRVFEEAHNVDAYSGMGTTVVSAYFSLNRKRVYVAHVGDSRCYRLRGGDFEQLTQDHTLEAAGIKGPTGGYLSRAVGIEENVEVDVRTEAVAANDTYLLCSDGLSRMATDAEIREIMLVEPNLQVAVQRLIDLANARGGKDNVTVILVRAEEPAWKA